MMNKDTSSISRPYYIDGHPPPVVSSAHSTHTTLLLLVVFTPLPLFLAHQFMRVRAPGRSNGPPISVLDRIGTPKHPESAVVLILGGVS